MQTCDRHRRNKPLVIDPRKEKTINTIKYTSYGEIFSTDKRMDEDIQQALNLNVSHLIFNRKSALDALKTLLRKKRASGDWTTLALAYKKKLIGKPMKEPYVGILLWYLENKIHN
jgi:hypothetical protein